MSDLKGEKYIIFTKDECPFCHMAADLLSEQSVPYELVRFNGEEQEIILEDVKKAYGWPTVPIVVSVNGDSMRLIGGYTDLAKIFEDE